SNMGLTECFDYEKSDFSRMGRPNSGNNLYISLVRQKAKIIVDEEGTEAAAVTEILARDGGGMLSEPKQLYFNEPFLYMIMDMDRELPLFIGILDNPKGE
ncbi:MAG: serine protease, partial [Lachnospiraceae bacterium]|nr:serine protease [Lachnospiraceae bacterium]